MKPGEGVLRKMNSIKDESFNPQTAIVECRYVIPTHRLEYAGWQVLTNVDHGVRNVVDVWAWGPVMSKIERVHGL